MQNEVAMAQRQDRTGEDEGSTKWLVIVYRIPSEPTRLRAGVWRKLKGMGAIYLQNSVAAIPASTAAERSLRTLRAEIGAMGGTAVLLSAAALAGAVQLRARFNAARDDEYEEIVDRCEDFVHQVEKEYEADHFTFAELEENDVDLVKLRDWFARIQARDVLGAGGREAAGKAIDHCAEVLEEYAGRVYAAEEEQTEGP